MGNVNPDKFYVMCFEESLVGFSFFSLVLLPPPIWEKEVTLYSLGRIEMENRHIFCESDM